MLHLLLSVFDALSSCDSRYISFPIMPRVQISSLYPILNSVFLHVIPILLVIFNYSLIYSVFSFLWKQSHVILIKKNENPTLLFHFKLISILNAIFKILEKIVYISKLEIIWNNNLLDPFQTGFHTTQTALLKLTEDIWYACDTRQVTLLILFDFNRVFYTVDHSLLIRVSILRFVI